MFKVVIGFETPTPQEFYFHDKDKACEFADKYHDIVNKYVDVHVFEESDMDNHIDDWIANKFIIGFDEIMFIKGRVPEPDYLPF